MLKRLTSLILVLAMMLTMLPVSALAEESGSAETIVQETVAGESIDASEETASPSEEPTEEVVLPSEPEAEPAEEETVPAEMVCNAAMKSDTESFAGACGEALTWSLDQSGTLVISGTGTMDDYTAGTAPWASCNGEIVAAVLAEGITGIGQYAFYGCGSLEHIVLPGTLAGVGSSAFEGCAALKSVFYGLDSGNWAAITINAGNESLTAAVCYYYSTGPGTGTAIPFAGGDGSAENPYQVATAAQLNAVRYHLEAHYVQTADINLEDSGWTPIGYDDSGALSRFTGTYDGANHIISNMCITSDNVPGSYAGLFACNYGALKNIVLKEININVSRVQYVGAVGGFSRNPVENCRVSGTIYGDNTNQILIGGILGEGKAVRCRNEADITADCVRSDTYGDASIMCGGISGLSSGVQYCVNYGNLTVSAERKVDVGGITGQCGGNIDYCVNYGNVIGHITYGRVSSSRGPTGVAGGMDAYSSAQITNCVNFGKTISITSVDANASLAAGGIAGYIPQGYGGTTVNCYNLAESVTGGQTGRIRGYVNTSGTAAGLCYSIDTTQVNGAIPTLTGADTLNGVSMTKREIHTAIADILALLELEPEVTYEKAVLLYSEYDRENETVRFGSDQDTYAVLGTDTELDNPDVLETLLGQYILAEIMYQKEQAEPVLINMNPVDSMVGVVSAVDSGSITIDDASWPIQEVYALPSGCIGETVLYHLHQGQVVGLEVLSFHEAILHEYDETEKRLNFLQSETDPAAEVFHLSYAAPVDTKWLLDTIGRYGIRVRFSADSNDLVYHLETVHFNMQTDGWSFVNHYSGFGYLPGYRIPVRRYREVFGDSYAAVALGADKKTFKSMMPDWGGSCYGMTSTALLFYLGMLDWERFGTDVFAIPNSYYDHLNTVFGKTESVCTEENKLTKLIEQYQILCKGDSFGYSKSHSTLSFMDQYMRDEDGEYQNCLALDSVQGHYADGSYIETVCKWISDSDEPLLCYICGYDEDTNETKAHNLLIRNDRDMEYAGDGWYRAYVYDPNTPYLSDKVLQITGYDSKDFHWNNLEEDRYIELNPDLNLWRYNGNTIAGKKDTYWGSNADDQVEVTWFNGFKTEEGMVPLMPDYMFVYSISNVGYPTSFNGTEPWMAAVRNKSVLQLLDSVSFEVKSADGTVLGEVIDGLPAFVRGDVEFLPAPGGSDHGGRLTIPYTDYIIEYTGDLDLTILGAEYAFNLASDGAGTMKVSVNEGSLEITAGENSSIVTQITDVHSNSEYVSVNAEGKLRSDDTVVLQLQDDSLSAEITDSSVLELTVDNHNQPEEKHVVYLDSSDGNVTIEDVCDDTWQEHIHFINYKNFQWTEDLGVCTFCAVCRKCGYEIRLPCDIETDIIPGNPSKKVYTAKVMLDGITYTDIREYDMDQLCVRISQEYVILRPDQTIQLAATVMPNGLADNLQWRVEEGGEGVISADETGNVTALKPGTAYILAIASNGETKVAARCRVDVAETETVGEEEHIILDGIQLSTIKLTSELYSTDYAEFDLLLRLPQNMNFQSADGSVIPESNSVAIGDVRFETDELNRYFDLIALDDRRIAVVPTDYAAENPSEVAKSYKSKVVVTVEGADYTAEEILTLNVKKSTPKLKATVPAFNSFYTGQTQEIKVTGGTVTGITLDPNKVQPDWLTLNADGTLSLNENEAQKSGKVYLVVETEEWRIPTAVTLAVKNTRKAPGLKLSATSVKMTADAADSSGIALKLLPKSKKDSLAALKVADLVSQTAGYTVTGFNAETGTFILNTDSGFVPGKVTLNVSFTDTDEVLHLTVKVSVQTVSLKLSAKTVTLNKALNDSAVMTVSAAPADYIITSPVIEGNEDGKFAITYENGKLTILPTDAVEAGKTYKLSISAGGSKKAALSVKVIDAAPCLTLKAQSSVDLSFPDKTAAVTATVKNYASGTVADYTAVITAPDGAVSDDFAVTRNGTVFMIRCNNTDISTGAYKLTLKLTLPEGTEVENTVKLTVKRTAVKLKLTPAKLTLNSTIADKASVAVTCATKGYDFSEPIWELKAKNGKDSAEGKLDTAWNNGKLEIAVNDNTEPGATYKLLVKANAYAPAATLTITIPTEAKSVIKSSLKAKGAIDVIRAGSAVTIMPSYKNATAAGEETLNIYSSADNYVEPVNDLFNIEKDGQGRYVLTAAEGLDHSRTYKAQLVTKFGDTKVKSGLLKLTVKMGSAKLTLNAEGNILFGNDCRSRIGFTFSTKDAALNAVQEVTVKADKKGYDQMLEVIDLGNGEFAIGFKDETVDRSLLGKTVTITLNIRLSGNETEKVNCTAKLKLTALN